MKVSNRVPGSFESEQEWISFGLLEEWAGFSVKKIGLPLV